MKVILNQDVYNLGNIGDIVTVRNGYARNFLIPEGMAIFANEENQKAVAHQKKILEKKKAKLFEEAKSLANLIDKTSITVAKPVGEDERIFGAVTTAELEEQLEKEGIKVSRKNIKLLEEIKKVGVYTAQVKLHSEVTAKFKVWVVAQ